MAKVCVFTIVSKNYLHYARTLLDSVLQHADDVDVYVGLCDESGDYNFSGEVFRLIEIGELDNIKQLNKFIFKYTILELNTAIKPYIIEKLFKKGYEKVIYFDPDIKIYSSLSEMIGLLDANDVLLTPHLTGLLDDGKKPDELDILRSGTYNLGYIALKNNNNTNSLVRWWQSKLYENCVVDLDKGLFVDQKWMDMVPGMFDGVFVNRNPAWNLAYWNLNHRDLTTRNDKFFVNGNELVFFHFSGFSPGSKTLSKHQNRFSLKSAGHNVNSLCEDYSLDLEKNGYQECSAYPYAFSRFPDGVPIPDLARIIYREQLDWKAEENNVWSREGAANFQGYLNEPVKVGNLRKKYITRLAKSLYDNREDLIAAFPDLSGENGIRYAHWYVENAKEQAGFDEIFIDPVRSALREHAIENRRSLKKREVVRNRIHAGIYRFANRYRHMARPFVTPEKRQEIKIKLLKKSIRDDGSRDFSAEAIASDDTPALVPEFGVNLYGYVHAESGVGQSARANIEAFRAAGVPVNVIDFRHGNVSRMSADVDEKLKGCGDYGINLFHINADQVIPALDVLGFEVLEGHYNIGFWAWELPNFPDEWVAGSDYLDEIWTPSQFCKESIEKKIDCPVRVVPHAVWKEAQSARHSESSGGLGFDRFAFLTMFDCLSVPERKNVFAVIEAFESAFGDSRGSALLVIKVTNLDVDNSFALKLKEVARSNPDIKLIPEYLDREDVFALLDAIDCFVSLHRAEGFGLGIAESMLMKKPVITTGWSGNMEFCNKDNALLIDYQLVELAEDHGPYKKGQIWADPSVDHAATLMKAVFDDKELVAALGNEANRYVTTNLSPAKIGERLKDVLDNIWLGVSQA